MAEKVNAGQHGLKAELFVAAIRQGPSFVVLLLILFGGWQVSNYALTQGIPAHIEQIKAGYREAQEQDQQNLNRLIDAFDREADRFEKVIEVIEPLIQNKDLIRQNHELLVEAIRELRLIRAREIAGKDS